MDPYAYKAARSGDFGFFKTDGDSNGSNRSLYQKTPTDNNILHVAAEFKQIDIFKNVPLDDRSPLFWATNKKGNTPLHVAARVGCQEVVKFLIERAQRIDPADQESGQANANALKELLRRKNSEQDTALHVAVRNGHVDVVTLLVKADPQLCSVTNSANESPLFLAVKNGFANIVLYILNESSILSFHGTNGVTALHVAVTREDLTGRAPPLLVTALHVAVRALKHLTGKCILPPGLCILEQDVLGIVETMVSKNPGIIREVDELGWTPLHYAAVRGNLEATRVLLKLDSDASYILDKSGMSALHVAAYAGRTQIMEEMVGCRPDTRDLLNDKGQTILHVAVLGEQINVVNYILNNPTLVGLINEVDNDGNTPLHLAARQHNFEIITTLTDDRTETDLARFVRQVNLVHSILKSWIHPRPKLDKTAVNGEFSQAADFLVGANFGELESMSELDRDRDVLRHLGRSVGIPFFQQQITSDFKKLESPGRTHSDQVAEVRDINQEKRQTHSDQVAEVRNINLLLATLVATVTFGAGLNVPGGFKSNGTPVLQDSGSFVAFITLDVAAFLLACMAIMFDFPSVFIEFRVLEFVGIRSSTIIIQYSIICMVMAFFFGTFAVMPEAAAKLGTSIGVSYSFISLCLCLQQNIRNPTPKFKKIPKI